MRIERVSLADKNVKESLSHLCQSHKEELYADYPDVSIDYPTLIAAEEAGQLFTLAAIDTAGQYIGYATTLVVRHPFFDLKQATNIALFVDKGRRGGRAGVRLILETQRLCESLGVEELAWGCPVSSPLVPILEKLGYKLGDISIKRRVV